MAIEDALAAFAHDQPLDELPGRAKKPYVLLRNLEGSEMIRRPMPDFGDASAGQEIQGRTSVHEQGSDGSISTRTASTLMQGWHR